MAQRSLSPESSLTYTAQKVRKERTGIHASLDIALRGSATTHVLAWSVLNVERDDERVRLANSAHLSLGEPLQQLFPKNYLKHDLDQFCFRLWDAILEASLPEDVCGDPVGSPLEFCLKPYLIKDGGTILFAPPGRGKSYTALLFAASINAGCSSLWPTEKAKVMFINLERSAASLVRRLGCVNTVLGLAPDASLLMQNARGQSLSSIKEVTQRAIEKYKVNCVVLDSISRAGVGDLNENKPTNETIDTLNNLCPTWLALAHAPRADEAHIFGSIHFDAGADVVIHLISEQKETSLGVALKITKANDLPHFPMEMLAYQFDQFGLQTVRKAKKAEFPALLEQRKVSMEEQIEDYLLEVGKASATQVSKATNRDRSNVSTILSSSDRFQNLGKEGKEVMYGPKVF